MKAFRISSRAKKKDLVLAGAIVALILSIGHSRGFRLDVWTPAAFIGWYGLSLLIGGVSGAIGGHLIGIVPTRIHPAVEFGAVALLGLLGYVFQVNMLLAIVFRMVSWQ